MFEWNKSKAKENKSKHGISFAVMLEDFRQGEQRYVTIRLDRDIIDWFRSKVEEQGSGNYQTMLNDALRTHIERQEKPIEEVLRRVVREELQAAQ